MTRGVRLYLVGSFVLVSLAGCGRGFFQSAEREPWRAEAEIACLKSGAVKESLEVVRVEPISGPGACGAQYPLKVAALGEGNGTLGFANDLRPPGDIRNQPRWPVQPQQAAPPPTYSNSYPANTYSNGAARQPGYGPPSSGPISLSAPGVAQEDDEIDLPAEGTPDYRPPAGRSPYTSAPSYPPRERNPAPYFERQDTQPLPALGPSRGNPVGSVGPVAIKPTATLACPIVSTLDRWFAESVQPAAQRWFGTRVAEIKQISAYSCRGMNGNPHAHISEHAFGNALDISAFVLADGRRITVKNGWRGMPEEQGFLRDIQAGACQLFNTVLAPGSNSHHADHFHVDLMRRSSGRVICQPAAVSGDAVASRAGGRNSYAARDSGITGSLGGRKSVWPRKSSKEDEYLDD
jgi:hypothetical protein